MAKAELGDKQVCPSCSAKFYDLRRRPAHCPKCGHSFDPADEVVKVKRTRGRAAAYEPTYDDDDAEEAKAEVDADEAGEEEEVEETPELDAAAVDEPVLSEDEDEAANADALPPGFSEAEVELEEDEAADEAPILELEEDEDFAEEDLGEIPDETEDEDDAR